jgi:mono/diheme cytochrome c family protein
MKKLFPSTLSIGVALILIIFTLSACGQTNPSPTISSGSPTIAVLDGQALMQQRCSVCHSTSRITQLSGTTDQWGALVDTMISRGAQLSTSERQTLVDYLAQTYP